ncbi:MAG: M48 family metalloprotease [Burkholderiales bacterium]
MICRWRTFLFALICASCAPAWGGDSISILDRHDLALERGAATATRDLALTIVYFDDSWTPDLIRSAMQKAARILAQCGVAIASAELIRVDAAERYHYFRTAESRELARALQLPKPTIYFVAGTRQQPAFDAEAIGRGNSGTRPELRDTVWVARGARDLEIVLAHELAHVLMDSGAHSNETGNLMREDTAPQNNRLTGTQCAQLRETATSHGLLRPVR